MDDHRFDRLVRALATEVSARRRVLGWVVGSVPAVILPTGQEVAARCGNIGARCERDRDCCEGRRCKRGRCRCLPGRPRCGKICCPEGQVCAEGLCVPPAGTCPVGADTCINATTKCSAGTCSCLTTMTDGATRCGRIISTPCGICGNDGDCQREYGSEAFCVRPGGSHCGCQIGQGFCARQCR